MPSSWNWLLGGLALLGLAGPLWADPPADGAAPETSLSRSAVEDIVRRTVGVMNCNDCCGPVPTCYRCEAALEMPVLRPYFDSFSNGNVFGDLSGDDFFAGINVEPEYDFEASVRGWLSFVGEEGFGGRIRFWYFDAASEETQLDVNSSVIVGGDALQTTIEMNVLDLEAIGRCQWGCWIVEGSAGVRYANLELHRTFAQAIDFGPGNTGLFFENGKSTFEGVGPTGALEGRRVLRGGLSALVNGRASLVAGRTRVESVRFGDFFGEFSNIDVLETDDSIVVLETQIGLEYARCFGCTQGFFRACLEAQWWLDGGHVLQGGGGDPDSPHDDLSFAGITLTAGVRR